MQEASKKVTADHLKRIAYLYIRQSTLKQVMENTESTKRQYALRERAIALGWPIDRITVIDSDLGQSGAQATDREGFQKLVAEVGLGNAGIVMGLEVSRLARNSTDWHRLLEICALSNTLILDEDGIYDPAHFNDRLLLGLKGTMSEAELHVLRARLRGGILNKARRGELKVGLPIGFIHDQDGRPILDPDKQIQDSIHLLFKTFRETGSAWLTVKSFRNRGLLFPRQLRAGIHKGEIVWAPLYHSRILKVLKNPKYAGVFFFGRTRQSRLPNGKTVSKIVSKDQWHVFLPDSHKGYITLEEYEKNRAQLLQNAQTYGEDRKNSPPREGPALLQGIAICGKCGRRMTIRYHKRSQGDLYPGYVCERKAIDCGEHFCQRISGAGIDEAIGELLIESMTPVTLEVALNVENKLTARFEEADRLRKQSVERAQYEAEVARHRYMQVDPENRLVADTLEGDWNEKLRAVIEAKEEYERQRQTDELALTTEQRQQIMALTTDFPKLWKDPKTPDREKKRIVRLMLEDVTLLYDNDIMVNIRFKGGPTKTLKLPAPTNNFVARKTRPEIVEEVDRLLDETYDAKIAPVLNERGFLSGSKIPFSSQAIRRIRKTYNLKDHGTRLRERGLLNRKEMLRLLPTTQNTLKSWTDKGWLKTHRYGGGDRMQKILYEKPDGAFYAKMRDKRPSPWGGARAQINNLSQEV